MRRNLASLLVLPLAVPCLCLDHNDSNLGYKGPNLPQIGASPGIMRRAGLEGPQSQKVNRSQ